MRRSQPVSLHQRILRVLEFGQSCSQNVPDPCIERVDLDFDAKGVFRVFEESSGESRQSVATFHCKLDERYLWEAESFRKVYDLERTPGEMRATLMLFNESFSEEEIRFSV